MKTVSRIILPLLFLTFAVSCAAVPGDPPSVSIEQLKKQLVGKKKPVVVDVRTPEELSGELGHLDSVINIPLQEIESRYSELDKYKAKKIYVICRTQNRSARAAAFLNEKGYKAVFVEGGMKGWRAMYGEANK